MTVYKFEKSPCDVARLKQEIIESQISTVFDHASYTSPTIECFFRDDLSGPDQAALASIVTAHSGLPLPPVIATQPVEVKTHPIIIEAPFRTKMHATNELLIVEPSASGTVDWKLPEDLYIEGGSTTIANAVVGDWISCSVMDLDGVIPEAYRAAVCEAWPLVACYVVKEWVDDKNVRKIETTPLSTKIPKDFYMRLEYHACNEGVARKIGVNYFFLRKLV